MKYFLPICQTTKCISIPYNVFFMGGGGGVFNFIVPPTLQQVEMSNYIQS